MSDNAIPPVPPLQVPTQTSYNHAQLNVAPPQRSPSNQSLRGAMAQYLNDKSPSNLTSPIDTFFDSREHQPVDDDEDSPIKQITSFPASFDQRVVAGRTPDSLPQGTNQEFPKREGEDPDRDRELMQSDNTRARLRPAITGEIEGGSFLINSSSEEVMGQSPSTDTQSHKLSQRHYGAHPGPDAFGRPQSNKENIAPSRRANVGGKRTDAQVLSPISDRSHILSDHEQASRFLDADDDDEVFVVRPTKSRDEETPNSALSNRVWLEPSSPDEKLTAAAAAARLRLPLDGPRTSHQGSSAAGALAANTENEAFVQASNLPTVQVGDKQLRMSQDWGGTDAAKAVLAQDLEITEEDIQRARQIFEGDEEFVSKAGAAAWLGQTTTTSSRTRRAYMDLFDWNGVNILAAFRELCGKLLVKAESQQLDRVIDAFSERWCNCNPNHGFKDRGKFSSCSSHSPGVLTCP